MKLIQYHKLLAVAFIVFSIPLFGQTKLKVAKLDSLMDVYEQKNKLFLTLCISENGQTIYKRASGYSLFESDKQVKSDPLTKYRIGSITKTFTAVMILQLIEERKIKINTPLSKFFPKILNSKKITIDCLLKHRSGLHNFTDDPEYLSYMNEPKNQTELMDIIMKLPSDFEPGLKHSYSNTNYVLLGWIIEKVTKKSYAENLQQRITTKLGLQNTYVGSKVDIARNEARSFMFDGKQWVKETETDMSIPLGAGAIVSTSEDLTDFIEGIFNYQLLQKETVDNMIIQHDGYGMGIFTIPFYDRFAYGHNGRLDGFESMMAYFPGDKVAVAMSCNGINANTNDFLVGVLSICFDLPFAIPNFYSYNVPDNILQEYVGTYHCDMIKLDFEIIKEGNVIIGKAADQSSFPLDAASEKVFTYAPAALEIEFKRNISDVVDQFILKQSGMEFIFVKAQ